MSSNPRTNEWNLLKKEFDALVHKEGLRQESLEKLLDHAIRRRFGEMIASAAPGQKTTGNYSHWAKGDYVAWPRS